MEKVKVCLYWSYITVTSLIGIISAILLGLILFFHVLLVSLNEVQLGVYSMYAVFIVPLLLAIIGLFGACKKKKWMLILFAVGMILACLFMFVLGIEVMTGESELTEARRMNVGSLVNTSYNFQHYLKETQTQNQCCGLQGYVDWGYNIPESCLCTYQPIKPCVAAPNGSMRYKNRTNDQPIMIYKEPCLQFLIAEDAHIRTVCIVMMAFVFLWALSAVLCIFILCQMKKREDTSAVVYNPEVNASDNFSWAP